MSLRAELKQVFYDLAIINEPGRDDIAHFCRHDGIRIRFTRARTTWQSLGPSAVKPWAMTLEPLRALPPGNGRRVMNKKNEKRGN
ncbi:MAG: hypothetical protein WBO73_15780 [Gammaproteobacteria bacterium]|jgi:hypothetical protein